MCGRTFETIWTANMEWESPYGEQLDVVEDDYQTNSPENYSTCS